MPAIPERWLQDQVRALCAGLGLHVQHMEDARRSWLPGWPDLVILGTSADQENPAILYRELKGSSGNLSADQRKIGWLINQAGGDWALWRPSDLLNGRIQRELTAISPLGKGQAHG